MTAAVSWWMLAASAAMEHASAALPAEIRSLWPHHERYMSKAAAQAE
jgi:hypothetical protein